MRSALDAAGLPADFAFRYPHELSGGQRQRVVIAGALVMGPQLIVADEPVSMLDVSIRTELLRLMLDLRQERGLTYLFITHDLSLAWVIADRIAVMYLGKIMEIGPADQVIRSRAIPTRSPRLGLADAGAASAGGPRARTILVGETPTPRASRRAAGSTRAARWRSTAADEEPPLFDVGAGSRRHAGWPRADGRCRSCRRGRRRDGGRAAAAGATPRRGRPPPRRATAPIRVTPRVTPRTRRPIAPRSREALPPPVVADLLAASSATILAELAGLARRRLAPGAGRVERQRMCRAPDRGRAARVRRPDPHDLSADRPDIPPDLEAWDPPAVAEAPARPEKPGADLAAEFAGLRRDGVELVRGLTARTSAVSACTRRWDHCASTSCSGSGSTTTATTSARCSR